MVDTVLVWSADQISFPTCCDFEHMLFKLFFMEKKKKSGVSHGIMDSEFTAYAGCILNNIHVYGMLNSSLL